MSAAEQVVAALAERGLTLGVAESLTGGLVAAAITDVPGASAVLRGCVVAYATDVKVSVLGVDAAVVAAHGAVHEEVARQMAAGAARLLGADVGVATTGVAGPDPLDGQPPGRVFVAAARGERVQVLDLTLPGDRAEVRRAAVQQALALVLCVVR